MADEARRRVVVVAGMHRAGTSVVARGLMALGLDLGDSLMNADVRMNARGFFEDLDDRRHRRCAARFAGRRLEEPRAPRRHRLARCGACRPTRCGAAPPRSQARAERDLRVQGSARAAAPAVLAMRVRRRRDRRRLRDRGQASIRGGRLFDRARRARSAAQRLAVALASGVRASLHARQAPRRRRLRPAAGCAAARARPHGRRDRASARRARARARRPVRT